MALFAPPSAEAPTLVWFHGNGQHVGSLLWIAQRAQQEGLGFFAVEYPGYGVAEGRPSEWGIYAAAKAGLEWLEEEGVGRTVLVGQSIGSGPATEAATWAPRPLVLLTPFTSIPDVAKGSFWFLPVGLLVRDRFDNAAKAPSVKGPALVIHGTADELVPYAQGRALAEKLDAELVTVEGAGHDLLTEPVLDRVFAFAREASASPAP